LYAKNVPITKKNVSIIEKWVKNVKVAALKLVLEFIELHIMKNKLVIFTIFVNVAYLLNNCVFWRIFTKICLSNLPQDID
jgi:hypothetical protein